MQSLEAELERARDLDIDELADAIESIGFECTRCGACCKSAEQSSSDSRAAEPRDAEAEDPHTATVFPDEVRDLQDATDYDWRDVARPMPYGLEGAEVEETDGNESEDVPDSEEQAVSDAEGDAVSEAEEHAESDSRAEAEGPAESGSDAETDDAVSGETFEWALQTDACGDCTFYEEADDGTGACSVHEDRPLICETYPFSVALGGTSQPMGEAVDEEGMVRAHECEGLDRDISREHAEELATALKERAVRELVEAIAVRDEYAPADPDEGVVVHDSEGAKRPDGTPYEG